MPDQNQSDPNNSTPTIDPIVPSTPVVPTVDTTITTSTVSAQGGSASGGQQPSSSTFFPTEDTPPVPAFQTVTTTTPETTTTTTVSSSPVQPAVVDDQSSGSAAPVDFPPMTSSPKKKFGGGKVIATILGLFVLIGGVGAGIFLTQENQQFNQKADGGCPGHLSQDSCKDTCSQVDASGDSYQCSWDGNSCGKTNKLCGGSGGGGGQTRECSHNEVDIAGLGSSYAAKCLTLNAKNCQKDAQGKNTGFQCNCTDLSPNGTCTFYANNCSTQNLRDCQTDDGGVGGAGHCDSANHIKIVGRCLQADTGFKIPVAYTYNCPNKFDGLSGGCQDHEDIKRNVSSVCFLDNFCGAQQIDLQDQRSCFMSVVDRNGCRSTNNTPTPTPTGSISARCVNIKAYNALWEETPVVQLKNLKAGNSINFCVTGTTTAGTFDRARFTINGVLQADTTTHRLNTQDYCQNYTIPAGVTTFNITAEIHHVTLGWR